MHGLLKRICPQDERGSMSLIEVVVASALILGILVTTGYFFARSTDSQLTIDMRNKAVQVSQDFSERIMSVDYYNVGFYPSSEGYRDTNSLGEKTVTIPEDRDALGFSPLEQKSVGGVSYTVRTDVAYINPENKRRGTFPIRINIVTTWQGSSDKEESVSIEKIRFPDPTNKVPDGMNVSQTAGANGEPSQPTFYDEIRSYAGTVSSTGFGGSIVFVVDDPGDSPVSDIYMDFFCDYPISEEATRIKWSELQEVTGLFLTPTTLPTIGERIRYNMTFYDVPAELPCDPFNKKVNVLAVNDQGVSQPLSITEANYYHPES